MPDADEWVAQARSALEAGNRLVARGYWRRATRVAPDRLDIWLDLYQVTESIEERLRCLERIVQLDPTNVQAQADLEYMRQEAAAADETGAEGADPGPSEEASPISEGPAQVLEDHVADVRLDVTDEMRRQWDEAIAAGQPLVCIDHPHRETSLRCNRCSAPICIKCAVRTPVGFRCKECIKAQQSTFFTARWYDYPLAAFVALLLSVPGAIIANMAGWWFALIISPIAGGLIGGIVHRVVGRRRGRWLWMLVGVCIVLGALVSLIYMPSGLISIGIYAVAATSTAVGVLRLGRRQ